MYLSKQDVICKLADNFAEEEDLTISGLIGIVSAFTTGNYRTNRNGLKEEIMSKNSNYIQSGLKAADLDERPGRVKREFKAVVNRDSSVTVTLIDRGTMTHDFVFTKGAIMGYFLEYPVRNRFELCNFHGFIKRTIREFMIENDVPPLFRYDGQTEKINYVDHINGCWVFEPIPDVNDVNVAYGEKARYCAFLEALSAALIASSRGESYSELYKAACGLAG